MVFVFGLVAIVAGGPNGDGCEVLWGVGGR